MTRNLNWKISAKNLVTLKKGMGLRMENFDIMGVHWKIQFLEGCMKNQYIGSELPKRGALDSLQI